MEACIVGSSIGLPYVGVTPAQERTTTDKDYKIIDKVIQLIKILNLE